MARGWLICHKNHGLFFVSRVVFDPTRLWEQSNSRIHQIQKPGTFKKIDFFSNFQKGGIRDMYGYVC